MNTIQNISFASTGLFSSLIQDYIAQREPVRDFYHYVPAADAIGTVIEDKKKEIIDRELLADTIISQYQGSDSVHPDALGNIRLLKQENTFCIVTAHQLNIFTGPLYYIYKIAATVATCHQLKKNYPDHSFVPVYWMGSEDHDFEEINHIRVYNNKLTWTDRQGGATGLYSTEGILPLIDQIKTILGEGVHATHLIEIFNQAYALPSLTEATRFLVNSLFGEYGVVVVDGNDRVFKQRFSEVMKDELLHQHSVGLVTRQLQRLESKGYKQQATPRNINLFYLSKNSRERIEYDTETSRYAVLNTSFAFSREEILEELAAHPERFSPNVILRPLFQQMILPSLAYIGGAGELGYWLQLKPVFDFYRINFPQLLLRNSVLVINANIARKLTKIGLQPADLFKDIQVLKTDFITRNTTEDIDVSGYKKTVEQVFAQLQEVAGNVDASLVSFVGAELQKSLQSVDTIQKRMMKSLKQKNETELNQLEKIKTQLFPEQSLQERVENFSAYYAAYGNDFIRLLVNQLDVYNKQFLIISE